MISLPSETSCHPGKVRAGKAKHELVMVQRLKQEAADKTDHTHVPFTFGSRIVLFDSCSWQ